MAVLLPYLNRIGFKPVNWGYAQATTCTPQELSSVATKPGDGQSGYYWGGASDGLYLFRQSFTLPATPFQNPDYGSSSLRLGFSFYSYNNDNSGVHIYVNGQDTGLSGTSAFTDIPLGQYGLHPGENVIAMTFDGRVNDVMRGDVVACPAITFHGMIQVVKG